MQPFQIENKIHVFTGNVSIRWRDIDPFGIVNHAIYFTLMEEVRLKWFETIKHQFDFKFIYPIVEAHILFKNKIIYPTDIIINLYTGNVNDKSWVFYHEIYNENNIKEICAEASVTSITYDPVDKRVIPIPAELIKSLTTQFKEKLNE
jgi:YbgC/YbaW family acyl-CoA thioester hydrolase